MERMDQNEVQEQASVPTKTNPYVIPVSIIIGFGFIAAAIFYVGSGNSVKIVENNDTLEIPAKGSIRPVDETDHIRGNPNASILIVEYADFDCPFCKRFQETMNQIINEYGPDGRVAWVYRHFPIEQLHPNAKKIALASECIADLGGNKAFWEFSDLVYQERSGSSPTNITNLSSYATTVGVDVSLFNRCVEEERFMERVEADTAEALAIGAKGTPYSLILVGDQQGPIEGALPYEGVKQLIETLLVQIDGPPMQ